MTFQIVQAMSDKLLKPNLIWSFCSRCHLHRLPPINPKDFELPKFKDPRESGLKHGLTLDDIQPPPTYDHIVLPKDRKLAYVPSQPILAKEEKTGKRLHEIIGIETDLKKNTVLSKQFGIVALSGGTEIYSNLQRLGKVSSNRVNKKGCKRIKHLPTSSSIWI